MTTKYPDSRCEAHTNVSTSEPVCLICMQNEIEGLIARLKRAERTWRDREPPHCATCDCEVPNG
jgi:hypothetical protein